METFINKCWIVIFFRYLYPICRPRPMPPGGAPPLGLVYIRLERWSPSEK